MFNYLGNELSSCNKSFWRVIHYMGEHRQKLSYPFLLRQDTTTQNFEGDQFEEMSQTRVMTRSTFFLTIKWKNPCAILWRQNPSLLQHCKTNCEGFDCDHPLLLMLFVGGLKLTVNWPDKKPVSRCFQLPVSWSGQFIAGLRRFQRQYRALYPAVSGRGSASAGRWRAFPKAVSLCRLTVRNRLYG